MGKQKKNIMNYIFKLLFVITFILGSCISHKKCKEETYYIKSLKSKRKGILSLQGIYCIHEIDTVLNSKKSIFVLKIYNRSTGKQVENGLIGILNQDTTIKEIYNSVYKTEVLPGKYNLYAMGEKLDDLFIKNVMLRKNKLLEVKFYLGMTIQ